MNTENIRVRIAPSPSGNLHVGTARTALLNYLFAKNKNGKFILRIEDTDLERSEEQYIKNIFDSLKAMGLSWDEGPDIGGEYGPYKQSERLELYEKYAKQLVDSGHAYYCWCSQEELDAEKEQAREKGENFLYSKRCQNVKPEEVENYLAEGRKPTIRFSMPSKELKFNDLIKGELSFETGLIGDFVIIKSNGTPSYNFAVVVDDMEMKISHVIRGEDHISNTPRQILIYRALGAVVPEFAHVGMILAPDKTKLSKRHGATAVSEFIQQGYLPEAFVNFLALLGWSSPDGEEVKSLENIISLFSLDRVSSSPAVFEFDKLNWINGVYIRNLETSQLTDRLLPYLEGLNLSEFSREKLELIVDSVKERLTILSDVVDAVSFFFGEGVYIDDETKKETLDTDEAKKSLTAFLELAESINYENIDSIHEQLGDFRKNMKPLKPKQVMWPLRVALTGRTQGADIAAIISVLGKEKVKYRINSALNV